MTLKSNLTVGTITKSRWGEIRLMAKAQDPRVQPVISKRWITHQGTDLVCKKHSLDNLKHRGNFIITKRTCHDQHAFRPLCRRGYFAWCAGMVLPGTLRLDADLQEHWQGNRRGEHLSLTTLGWVSNCDGYL